MRPKGLRDFGMHTEQATAEMQAFQKSVAPPTAVGTGVSSLAALPAETAARHYLGTALASDTLPSFSAANVSACSSLVE
jgi:hypothetical protein